MLVVTVDETACRHRADKETFRRSARACRCCRRPARWRHRRLACRAWRARQPARRPFRLGWFRPSRVNRSVPKSSSPPCGSRRSGLRAPAATARRRGRLPRRVPAGTASMRSVLAAGRTSKRTVWPAACNSRTTTDPMKPLPPVTKTFSDRWVRTGKRGLSGGIAQRHHGRHSAIHFARAPRGTPNRRTPALIGLNSATQVVYQTILTWMVRTEQGEPCSGSQLAATARLDRDEIGRVFQDRFQQPQGKPAL